MLPSARTKASALTTRKISELNPAACVLPVYASQPGSPPHHATLGSGWVTPLPGRVVLLGPNLKVSAHRFLLHQASPGARSAQSSGRGIRISAQSSFRAEERDRTLTFGVRDPDRWIRPDDARLEVSEFFTIVEDHELCVRRVLVEPHLHLDTALDVKPRRHAAHDASKATFFEKRLELCPLMPMRHVDETTTRAPVAASTRLSRSTATGSSSFEERVR